ncbi:MAG: GNAT family N-acetyltransferase [Myxococcales bacterium]|nr:GNAT family N-acetyltransferase [Myxococcales bacterium]
MRIIDLDDEHRGLFATCLEDWSDEMKEAGPRRARWVERELGHGLRAKLALDDAGRVGGMIQYLPIERSMVDGSGLYFIPCIWVHGHRQGRGDFQGHGMGTALLAAAEDDARALGAGGMAAWGLWLPVWMKASWYKKHGYRKADRQGMSVLVWKPFRDDALAPRWYPRPRPAPPLERVPGKVTVTVLTSGWCSGYNLCAARAERACRELGDAVAYREIDTSERAVVARWGDADALYVDGRPVRNGPPPSYTKLRARIAKRLPSA